MVTSETCPSSTKGGPKTDNMDHGHTYNDAVIVLFEIFKPGHRLVARIFAQIHTGQLRDPSFFRLHGPTIGRASLPDAEMLVVASSEPVVESAVCGGEGCAGGRVPVHADNVDILGSGPPGLDVLDSVVIGAPEHQDLGIIGNGGVDVLPGRGEFLCGYDAFD